MHRTPHPHGPSLGRPAVALVSVLALLAFACFPVLAQAETVYETEQTNLPGNGGGKSPTHQKNPVSPESSPAHSSGTPDDGGSGQSTPGSSDSQNKASKDSNPSSPGGSGQTQGKDGNGAGSGKQAGLELETAKPLANSTADDDSSSPLIPILIAVIVLAAISVGAVLIRQRRGSGGLFSPKAS